MDVFAVILAGGETSSLSALTERRPTAAMPFGGKYRIIDFTLSNCANSGIFDVAVLLQYRPHSLTEHIGNGRPWDLDRSQGGIHLWQPYRGRGDQGWQRGSADALYQNRDEIADAGCDTLLVLSGDHIYKMDYRGLLRRHETSGADATIAVMNVPREETNRFGIVRTDDDGRIVEFREKPQEFAGTLASMGIYVFRTSFLLDKLNADAADPNSAHHFGHSIFPAMIKDHAVYAYQFEDYWMDVDTVPAYWQAHMDLLQDNPTLDLYDQTWTIHTRSEEQPPVKLVAGAKVTRGLLSNGCLVAGTVVNSVLSPGVVVEEGAEVRDSIIMNDTLIRGGARVDRCILDKDVVVGAGAQLGYGEELTANRDAPDILANGITIVGKGAHIPDGVRVGRNCRIDTGVQPDQFTDGELPSGQSILDPAYVE